MTIEKIKDYSVVGGVFAAITLALAGLQYAIMSGVFA